MSYLSSLVVSGLVVGTMYGLVAMGFAIIYKGIQWTGKKLDQIDNRRG